LIKALKGLNEAKKKEQKRGGRGRLGSTGVSIFQKKLKHGRGQGLQGKGGASALGGTGLEKGKGSSPPAKDSGKSVIQGEREGKLQELSKKTPVQRGNRCYEWM